MGSRFFVVPQWQGSGSDRAMQLVAGAEAIVDDLPRASTEIIDVPLEAGDAEGTGILRHSSLRVVRDRLGRALSAEGAHPVPVVIGGDCGVEYAAVQNTGRQGRVVLLWADAHADLNTAESSPSGAFHGMVLRAMIDDGLVAAQDVILLGVRDMDDAEADCVRDYAIEQVGPEGVADAVAARIGDGAVLHIHVDLDVLDPGAFASVGFATPFGLELPALLTAIADARGALPLAGAAVTEYAPPTGASAEELADDAATILRVIGALTS